MGVYTNLSTNIDGAKAASQILAASANNVARSNVPRAMPDRVVFEDVKNGGVETARVDRLEASEDEKKLMEATQSSGIDLANEAIYQMIGKNAFGANVEIAKSSLVMYSQILNIHV